MPGKELPNSTAKTLRIAIAVEVVFLAMAGLLMFTEHRAHYLGALPYALAIAGVTMCLWLQLQCRKYLAKRGDSGGQPQSGERS